MAATDRRIHELLAGAQQGIYSLPDEVRQAQRTAARLADALQASREAQRAPNSTPADVEHELIATALEKAASGDAKGEFVDTDRYLEAECAQARVELQTRVLAEAAQRATYNLTGAVAGRAEQIVLEHLRPPFNSLLHEVGKVAPDLGGATDPASVLAGDEKAHKAWRRLEELTVHYSALRRAWKACYELAFKDEVDDPAFCEQFSSIKNLGSIWPTRHVNPQEPVWPREPVPFLAWLALSDAIPWLPIPEDFGEALEVERERVRELQRSGTRRLQSRREPFANA